MNGIEAARGRLGAVLHVRDQPSPARLSRSGPFVVTTAEDARLVLTDAEHFDFPADVSREPIDEPREPSRPSRGPRTPHEPLVALTAVEVERGTTVLRAELADLAGVVDHGGALDPLVLMREPLARSTTAAVLADLPAQQRDGVADLVLAWIDALGPVIARRRSPGRWSRLRRAETGRRRDLESALADLGCPRPAVTATMLAAGIQVPVAASAWLLVHLAQRPVLAGRLSADPDLARAAAWETLRVSPPTWLTARVTTAGVRLGDRSLPEGSVVLVSPLLLGRLDALAPGAADGCAPLAEFDPERWQAPGRRPGAWLPFGAGPHACPGRSLGLEQLTLVAAWADRWRWSGLGEVRVDQSRGIAPVARLRAEPRGAAPA